MSDLRKSPITMGLPCFQELGHSYPQPSAYLHYYFWLVEEEIYLRFKISIVEVTSWSMGQ